MNRRDTVIALFALAASFGVLAQQLPRIWRIGFLAVRSRSTPSHPDVYYDAFVEGMRELGYVEGKNLVIEWRYADGKYELLPGLADELVRLKVELLATHTVPATEALLRATSTIPIVNASFADPVGAGFAASLARPGGNITGLALMNIDVSPKQVELLRTMVPALSRVVVLMNPGTPPHAVFLKSVQVAAQQLGVTVVPVHASTPKEIERAFSAIKREHANAVIIPPDGFFISQQPQIAKLAERNRLLSMFYYREAVKAGGLMSYGANNADLYRRAATYVDKILKGAKPGELPIEQPTMIFLAINRKTAKALGLTIPQELLLRADEVIE